MRRLLRERVLDVARELVAAEGWSAVNMSRVAKDVGVSRPVLYKEIGNRQALGEALLERETDLFLAGVAKCLAAQPDDVVAGLADAVEYTLRESANNTLIKAILTGEGGTDPGLLPLLAVEPEPVLHRAISALSAAVRAQYDVADLDDEDLASAMEVVVRLALSHMMQPLGPIDHAVEQIRKIGGALLAR
ncbi:TetR/AcrR family transcriptional regulator [Skermania sp. ID1734]|nr:TetR/AcrR family transcriptional regulator [Skermania sp. ID1734]